MKKNTLILKTFFLLFSITLFSQYCVPPQFQSGPFNGILNVNFKNIDNSTSFADGYTDYTTTTPIANIALNETIDISVRLRYTLLNTSSNFTEMLHLRVWIDWNQNFNFDDDNEDVIIEIVDMNPNGIGGCCNNMTFTGTITVPNNATIGETRMRVYNDMLVEDGHLPPNSCGYDGNFGQHGEVEDYKLNVVETLSVNNQLFTSFFTYNNSLTEELEITFQQTEVSNISFTLFNVYGKKIFLSEQKNLNSSTNKLSLDVSHLKTGVYFLLVNSNDKTLTKKVIISK